MAGELIGHLLVCWGQMGDAPAGSRSVPPETSNPSRGTPQRAIAPLTPLQLQALENEHHNP